MRAENALRHIPEWGVPREWLLLEYVQRGSCNMPGCQSLDEGGFINIDLTPRQLIISNSGETPEILTILPIIKRMGVGLIALSKQNLRILQSYDTFV